MVSGLFTIPQHPLLCASVAGERPFPRRQRRFLAGPENLLVAQALQAVQHPSPSANPLVITGISGSGKSLLVELLVAEFQARYADVVVHATTAVDLARAYAHAVQTDAMSEFRQRFSRLHMLAIDDLQRLEDKPAAQQELCQLIDSLVRRGCLVLATLRRHPLDAPELSYALASRLSAGLVVPLALPEVAVRRALVEHFAADADVELPPEVIDALAPEGAAPPGLATAPLLRHAVLGLGELARTSGGVPGPEHLAQFLQEIESSGRPALRTIAAAVGKQCDVTVGELRGKARTHGIAAARGVAMLLARRLTGVSYAQIGRYFGNRDHSTVMHACRKTASAALSDVQLSQLIDELTGRLSTAEMGP